MPRPQLGRRRSTETSPILVPGQAAYRNRLGRTGLDPMDAYREQGYMVGWLIRKLFTGSVRTRKIVDLTLMLFGGLFFTIPLLLVVSRPRDPGGELFIRNSLSVVPWTLIGLGLLFSFVVNLLELARSSRGNFEEKEDSSQAEE